MCCCSSTAVLKYGHNVIYLLENRTLDFERWYLKPPSLIALLIRRAGQRCFELSALIGSPQLLEQSYSPAGQTLGRTGQTLRACTAAEAL